ncbi:MAG: hypothetical protein HHJ09_13955 [Glaciimonas sp.]|nr:hypothetical protein [Glaciimonas sp.]
MTNKAEPSAPQECRTKTDDFNKKSQASLATASNKLTSSQIAKKIGIKTNVLIEQLIELNYIEEREEKYYLTVKGKQAGGESRTSPKFGLYFLWPDSFKPSN